jgi:hypothetical protein
MTDQQYESVLKIAKRNVGALIDTELDLLLRDEDAFRDRVFDLVLDEVDDSELAVLNSPDVADVCHQVVTDTLGNFVSF